MAVMPVEEKVFQLPIDIEAAGKIEKTLKTADTYVDKDIHIEIDTPAGELKIQDAGTVEARVSTDQPAEHYLSNSATNYSFNIIAEAQTSDAIVDVKTEGFISKDTEVVIEGTDADPDVDTLYLKEGSLDGGNTADAESETVTLQEATASDEGFVIKVTAESSVFVDNSGWFEKGSSAASKDVTDEKYFKLAEVDFTNTEADPDAFENISEDVPALIEGSYLFLKEGYIKDSKIELAKLVPDGSNLPTTGTESDLMYKTVRAYNNDGKLIAGTMGDAKLTAITADDAAATIDDVDIEVDGDKFKVTGTADITGNASVDTETRGLAVPGETKATGEISGTATLDATLNKIVINTAVSSDSVVVSPVIEKESATNVLSGDITDTQPAEGQYYVAVSVPADYQDVIATPIVTDEGYGIEGEGGASIFETTIYAGMTESGIHYISIDAGSHSVSAGGEESVAAEARVSTETEVTDATKFDGDLDSGIVAADEAPTTTDNYIVIKTNTEAIDGEFAGSAVCAINEGYVESEITEQPFNGPVSVEVSEAQNLYIKIYDGTIL